MFVFFGHLTSLHIFLALPRQKVLKYYPAMFWIIQREAGFYSPVDFISYQHRFQHKLTVIVGTPRGGTASLTATNRTRGQSYFRSSYDLMS